MWLKIFKAVIPVTLRIASVIRFSIFASINYTRVEMASAYLQELFKYYLPKNLATTLQRISKYINNFCGYKLKSTSTVYLQKMLKDYLQMPSKNGTVSNVFSDSDLMRLLKRMELILKLLNFIPLILLNK